MATYLVVHTPIPSEGTVARKPSDLVGLSQVSVEPRSPARWLKTLSPDLHDDRLFTLWEASNAAEIVAVMERFGFLNNMAAVPLRVKEWGPADVLASQLQPHE